MNKTNQNIIYIIVGIVLLVLFGRSIGLFSVVGINCPEFKTNAVNGNYGDSSIWIVLDVDNDGDYDAYGYYGSGVVPYASIFGETPEGYNYRIVGDTVYIQQGSVSQSWLFTLNYGAASNADLSCESQTTHYSCSGEQCVEDVNGQYISSDCDGECTAIPEPTERYKCDGISAYSTCVRDDATGTYTTSNCDNQCVAPITTCSENWELVQDDVRYWNSGDNKDFSSNAIGFESVLGTHSLDISNYCYKLQTYVESDFISSSSIEDDWGDYDNVGGIAAALKFGGNYEIPHPFSGSRCYSNDFSTMFSGPSLQYYVDSDSWVDKGSSSSFNTADDININKYFYFSTDCTGLSDCATATSFEFLLRFTSELSDSAFSPTRADACNEDEYEHGIIDYVNFDASKQRGTKLWRAPYGEQVQTNYHEYSFTPTNKNFNLDIGETKSTTITLEHLGEMIANENYELKFDITGSVMEDGEVADFLKKIYTYELQKDG